MHPKWTISFRGRKKKQQTKTHGLRRINEAKGLRLQLDVKCKHREL